MAWRALRGVAPVIFSGAIWASVVKKCVDDCNSPVPIYHSISRTDARGGCEDIEESVRKRGVLCLDRLVEAGLVEDSTPATRSSDETKNTYWTPNTWDHKMDVMTKVNPDKTMVYNCFFRSMGHKSEYERSKMSLTEYQRKKRRTLQLLKGLNRDEYSFFANSLTAEPQVVKKADLHKHEKEVVSYVRDKKHVEVFALGYLPEVIIPGIVPPEELVFPGDATMKEQRAHMLKYHRGEIMGFLDLGQRNPYGECWYTGR